LIKEDVKRIKKIIRERIWKLMEELDIAKFPRPVYGRIPNFIGAEKAAERLCRTSIWRKAEVIKANPDSPQQPVRYKALLNGKKLVMATPRLKKGFLLLDPAKIPYYKIRYASTIRGAFRYGKLLSLTEIPSIDLIVTGCVAIDKYGGRVGKGGGYAELEYAILRELDAINDDTMVITTIHDIQIIDEKIPIEKHDLTIDAAFTPTKTLYIRPRPAKPRGIYWDLLGDKESLDVFKELKRIITDKKRSI